MSVTKIQVQLIENFFQMIKTKQCKRFALFDMAERKGFEPLIPCGIRAFQARALGQTTLPLHGIIKECDRNFTTTPPLWVGKWNSAYLMIRNYFII